VAIRALLACFAIWVIVNFLPLLNPDASPLNLHCISAIPLADLANAFNCILSLCLFLS